jgi:hypothetical protein
MLRSITLGNFKAFGSAQEVPLGPITLICGPNSAGKSSIIQSILLMRQSMQSSSAADNRIVFSGDDVNLGTYASALFQHKSENKMFFGFTFVPGRSRMALQRPTFSRRSPRYVEMQLDLIRAASQREQTGEAWITDVKYGVGVGDGRDGLVHLTRMPKKPDTNDGEDDIIVPDFQLKGPDSGPTLLRMAAHTRYQRSSGAEGEPSYSTEVAQKVDENLVRTARRMRFFSFGFLPSRPDPALLTPRDNGSFETLRQVFGPFNPLEAIKREFIDEMVGVSYLGPLRSPPARHYIISGSDKHTVGTRGERMPQLLYRRKRDVIPRINEKLKEFDIPYTIDVQSAGNTLTGDIITIALSDRNGIVMSPSDVGFGIGQLLPILVEGIVSIGRTICVEQPEIHLHPRLQGHVADFLVETAKTYGGPARATGRPASVSEYGGNQWIVETHSESIILRLQTLIKLKSIPADFVSVLYVQPTDKDGSRVLRLRLDEDGDFIDEWPDGFFEESFQEIFMRRK